MSDTLPNNATLTRGGNSPFLVPAGPCPDAAGDRQAVERLEQTLDGLQQLADPLDSDCDAPRSALPYTLPAGFQLSVVVPVYNEEGTIQQILARVAALPLPTEIVVVDDCSTDGTRALLERLQTELPLQVILKPRNEGKGAALRTGFAAARGDIVVVQDADLEYDPRDIPPLLAPILAGQADVVYGSRFLGEEPQDPSWLHRLGNAALTWASNLLTGLRLTDMETCYKAFRREVLQQLPMKQDRFGFEPEVTAKLARRQCRIQEVPIRYRPRSYQEGKKIGLKDAFNAFYCIVRYGLAD